MMKIYVGVNYLITLFFIFFLTSCSSESSEKILRKVESLHYKEQWKKYKLRPKMKGGGGEKGIFNLICLGFSTKEPLTIESARRLVISSAHDFLKLLEDCEEMHPYLFQLPFPVEKIMYEISSVDDKGIVRISENEIKTNKISYVMFSREELCYNNFVTETNKIKEVYCETYEEALRILAEEEKTKQLES